MNCQHCPFKINVRPDFWPEMTDIQVKHLGDTDQCGVDMFDKIF